jgi:glycosyltransferase involved in cell wall biosynthesis
MCPSLRDLPAPPLGRTGWPWTEGSAPLPPSTPDGGEWPRVTIVTPSYNQASFLEATLRSVLLQGYPNLEYLVMDGGSTDHSVEIIRKYEPWLTRWVSEPDGGQSAAINRGLALGTGLFASWINSDDMLCRGALTSHAKTFGFQPNTVYVGDCIQIDERDTYLRTHRGRVHTFEDLLRIRSVWRDQYDAGYIDQPAVLFPRELALHVGALDADNHRTMDYELWGKFFLSGATFRYTHVPVGMFRIHGGQKTADMWMTTRSLIETAAKLVAQAPGLSDSSREEIVRDLYNYQNDDWRRTGRLARLGLPEGLVNTLRLARSKIRRAMSNIVSRPFAGG